MNMLLWLSVKYIMWNDVYKGVSVNLAGSEDLEHER